MNPTTSHILKAGDKNKLIFISYTTRTPKLQPSKIEEWIKVGNQPLDVWYDHILKPGVEWWQEICKKVRDCDLFILIHSKEWHESKPCNTEYEYALALNKAYLVIQADRLLGPFQEIQVVRYCSNQEDPLRIIGQINSCLNEPPKAPPKEFPQEPDCPLPDLDILLEKLVSFFLRSKEAQLEPSELEELATKVGWHWNENYPDSRGTIYYALKDIEKTSSWRDDSTKKLFSKAYAVLEDLLHNHYLPWQRGHLQRTTSDSDDWKLLERPNVIDQLTRLWENDDPQRKKTLVVLEGWNPCGKTISVRHWLDTLEDKHKDKALSCLCWSFYSEFQPSISKVDSQSAEGEFCLDYQQYASLDTFFAEFLAYLGCKETLCLGLDKAWAIVKELKKCIGEKVFGKSRFILVIDGLDCHQYIGEDINDERNGQIVDFALQTILEQIASMQEVFCVITSRVGLKLPLSDTIGKYIEFLNLEERSEFAISEYCAVKFLAKSLNSLKETGEENTADIERLENLFKETIHRKKALFNTMLLSLLADYLAHEVLSAPAVEGHISGVIHDLDFTESFDESYLKLFSQVYDTLDYNQRFILQILASVRIPVSARVIQEFYSSGEAHEMVARYNKSSGLSLQNTSHLEEENGVITVIERLLHDYSSLITHIPESSPKVVLPTKPQFIADSKLYIHPRHRHYIEEKMRSCRAERRQGEQGVVTLYEAIHYQLYSYLRNKSTKLQRDKTLDYQLAAVRHCCLANKPNSAWSYFWNDVRKTLRHVPGNEFNRWSDDLAVLQYFFNKGFAWRHLSPYLDENLYAHILSEVGFDLKVVGRTYESIEVLNRALEEAKQRVEQRESSHKALPSNAEIASIAAGNLSKAYLLLGMIDMAIENARISVHYADEHRKNDQVGDNPMSMASRCWLGEALHHAGLLWESRAAFEYAEEFWKSKQNTCLDQTNYFRFSELRLDQLVHRMHGWVQKSWSEESMKPSELALTIYESLNEMIKDTKTIQEFKCPLQFRQQLFEKSLYQLLMGRMYLCQYDCLQKYHPCTNLEDPSASPVLRLKEARIELVSAETGLYRTGHQLYFARVLLQMAGLLRREAESHALASNTHQSSKEANDCLKVAFDKLTQSLDIITRGRMISLEIDYHLESAYLHWASHKIVGESYHRRNAILAIHDANSIANKYGYRRRTAELYSLNHEIEETFLSGAIRPL